jgi:hypothetical protein
MNWLSKIGSGLTRGATIISPGCRDVARLQSDSMDRKLSLSERVGVRLHLALCKWCRRYGNHLRVLRSAAHHCDEHQQAQASKGLSAEARERIRQKLQSSL